MGKFDFKEFEKDANKIGEDFISGIIGQSEKRWQEADAELDKLQNQHQRRDKEMEKLQIAEDIAHNRENKKRIFGNLNMLLFSNFDNSGMDYKNVEEYILEPMTLLYKKTIPEAIGVSDWEGVEAIERALKGYAKSLKEFGNSKKANQLWAEIFYLIHNGVHFTNENIDYIIHVLRKEIGDDKKTELEGIESIENFLKRIYVQFKYQPYWGYDFEEDPIDEEVKERLQYFRDNIFLADNERYGIISGLDAYIQKHIIEYNGNLFKDDKDIDDDEFDDEELEIEENSKEERTVNENNNSQKIEFPELEQRFKKERVIDESIEPKGLFDFSTKSRNKKVEKLQDKRSDLRDEINDNKKELLSLLKNQIKVIRKIIVKNNKLSDLERKKEEGKIKRSEYKDKKGDIKEDIIDIQDDIKENNTDIKRELKELKLNIEKYNEVNAELYSLTSSNRYTEEYTVSGEGIKIAHEISKDVNMCDIKSLSELFKKYL